MSSPAIAERGELPPKSRNTPRLRTVLVAIALFVMYLFFLARAVTEAGRRSVSLEIPPKDADYLFVDISVVQVDLLRSEMTTRISFQLAGQMAQDAVTPAADLHLLLNTVRGQQEFDFAKGQRINPIEAVFPLHGNVNFYPFDDHKGTLWFFLTIPERENVSSTPDTVPEQIAQLPGLTVGTFSLKKRTLADMKAAFTASIPGLTFRASKSAESVKGLTGIEVNLRRETNVILISIAIMLMMAGLAVGLVTMVLKIISGRRRADAFHITMSVSLIFGLPALRNVQPSIPPIGTLGDAVAFTWAELAAAGSAIALIVDWLLRSRSDNTPPAK